MMNEDQETRALIKDILKDYQSKNRAIDEFDMLNQPDSDVIEDIVDKMLTVIFPGFYKAKLYRLHSVQTQLYTIIEDIVSNLQTQICIALRQLEENRSLSQEELAEKTTGIIHSFLRTIPKIREYVETDVEAAFDGDPAAFNMNEIILAYPGLFAIVVSRFAHELYQLKVPLIPRIMTEYAHSKTGIDIHPGTTIGKYFFIDHGTGVVIGETSVIGDHVKVYQGVTIGALSTRAGQQLRGKKRHPTIESNVTIYSGASILGGETVIGEGAVIGSNAFITSSIKPGARVSIQTRELVINDPEEKDGSCFETV